MVVSVFLAHGEKNMDSNTYGNVNTMAKTTCTIRSGPAFV